MTAAKRYTPAQVNRVLRRPLLAELKRLTAFIKQFQQHVKDGEIEAGTLPLQIIGAIGAVKKIKKGTKKAAIKMEEVVEDEVRTTDEQLAEKRDKYHAKKDADPSPPPPEKKPPKRKGTTK